MTSKRVNIYVTVFKDFKISFFKMLKGKMIAYVFWGPEFGSSYLCKTLGMVSTCVILVLGNRRILGLPAAIVAELVSSRFHTDPEEDTQCWSLLTTCKRVYSHPYMCARTQSKNDHVSSEWLWENSKKSWQELCDLHFFKTTELFLNDAFLPLQIKGIGVS